MKLNKKSVFVDHMLLAKIIVQATGDIRTESLDMVNSIRDNDEINVEFKVNGFELDPLAFSDFVAKFIQFEARNIANADAKTQAAVHIKRFEQSNSKEAKLEKIKVQLEKVLNQLSMIQQSINLIK